MVNVALSLICAGALLATAIPLAVADSITLKSGEEIHGSILRETETEIVVEVKVAAGIIDQQTFEKSNVKAIAKTPQDKIAFEQIKWYKPGPHSVPVANYDSMISVVGNFLERYPNSAHAAEMQTALDGLKQERARVANGDIKWNNRWYNPEEAAKQKYQISAYRLLTTMRDQIAHSNVIGALNTFDQLEKAYPGSRVYPDAVDLASSTIYRLNGEIDRIAPLRKLHDQQFTDGIVLVSEPEKSQMIAARNAKIAAAEAAIAASSAAKWKPFQPILEKSIQDTKTACTTELQRLRSLPLATMRAGIAAADSGYEEVAAKNIEKAESKLKEAQKIWPANELLTGLNASITELKAQAKATATPSPAPAAPTPAKGNVKGKPAKPAQSPSANPAQAAAASPASSAATAAAPAAH